MSKREPKKSGGNRILSVRARNVKRIREVVIDDVGDIREVRGDTDQGKTSILDAIEAGLRGMDQSMVRRGADKAEIELEMSEATIKRIIGADGAETLMVTGADGKAVDRAKDFLKTLWGGEVFRPLAWVQLGGGEKKGSTERRRLQRNQLLEALQVSLDGEKIERYISDLLGPEHLEAMAQVNLDGIDGEQHPFVLCRAILERCSEFQTIKNAAAELAEETRRHTPAPHIAAPAATVAELREKETAAIEAYHEAAAAAKGLESLQARQAELRALVESGARDLPDAAKVAEARATHEPKIQEWRDKIAALEAELEAARASLKKTYDNMGKIEEAERKIAAHQNNQTALSALDAQLASAGAGEDLDRLREAMARAETLRHARELQDKHDAATQAEAEAKHTAKLFRDLCALFRDGIPKALLAEADLPVEGLTIDEDTILIDGVPLHQLGTSRQIRLGVLIAHAINPRSGFVLVDGAESMGSADRKALADTAAELGLQLIMTIVDPEAVPAPGVTVMREGVAV